LPSSLKPLLPLIERVVPLVANGNVEKAKGAVLASLRKKDGVARKEVEKLLTMKLPPLYQPLSPLIGAAVPKLVEGNIPGVIALVTNDLRQKSQTPGKEGPARTFILGKLNDLLPAEFKFFNKDILIPAIASGIERDFKGVVQVFVNDIRKCGHITSTVLQWLNVAIPMVIVEKILRPLEAKGSNFKAADGYQQFCDVINQGFPLDIPECGTDQKQGSVNGMIMAVWKGGETKIVTTQEEHDALQSNDAWQNRMPGKHFVVYFARGSTSFFGYGKLTNARAFVSVLEKEFKGNADTEKARAALNKKGKTLDFRQAVRRAAYKAEVIIPGEWGCDPGQCPSRDCIGCPELSDLLLDKKTVKNDGDPNGSGNLPCYVRAELGVFTCSTCCCKEGAVATNVQTHLVYGSTRNCGTFFAGADASIRAIIGIWRFGLVNALFGRTCFAELTAKKWDQTRWDRWDSSLSGQALPPKPWPPIPITAFY